MASSWLRSLACTAVMLPSSSFCTTSTSMMRTNSCSRRRLSSATILPVKFGSGNPITLICTGPAVTVLSSPSRARQDLLLLRVELVLGEHALVQKLFQVLELVDHVATDLRGNGRRGRWRGLGLRLLRLGLLVLLLGGLGLRRFRPGVVCRGGHAADDGGTPEWPSSHHVGFSPFS